MMNYNEKYSKIKDKLIQNSFPELSARKIFIGEIWMRGYYSGWAVYIPPIRFIGLSKNLRNCSNRIITGVIVHELCHFSQYAKRSLLKNALIGIYYWLSPRFRRQEESEVDKLVVQKGYAKEIYSAIKNTSELKKKAGVGKYYLDAEKIKKYAKSIGKW